MAQLAKIIDTKRSYIPINPNAFPENYHATNKEDYPEERVPVVPYEGYNFLPTAHGYKSYFGTNRQLDIDDLESRCDKIFVIQTPTYENKIIALCEDGIWTKIGSETGAWEHEITLDIPEEGSHLNWTYCFIGKSLFCYRATGAYVYVADTSIEYAAQAASVMTLVKLGQYTATSGLPAGTYSYSISRVDSNTNNLNLPSTPVAVTAVLNDRVNFTFDSVANTTFYRIYRTNPDLSVVYFDIEDTGALNYYWIDTGEAGTAIVLPDLSYQELIYDPYEFHAETPNFLNMTGQHGIFKAGIRLGFWDSENSIAWSSIDDFMDFVPSVTTLAGSSIFGDISGRVTTVIGYEDGFIIYALNSIVLVQQKVDATFQWEPKLLLDKGGILYPEQVASGQLPEQHFAYSSQGLCKIFNGRLELIIPEITDYFNESLTPITLHLLEGRYLVIQTMEEGYIDARVGFTWESVPAMEYVFPGATYIQDLIPGATVAARKVCLAGAAVSEGATEEQQSAAAAAASAAGAPAKKTGTTYKAKYNCYLSGTPIPAPGDITWGASPCATVDPNGIEKNMCPAGNAGKTSLLTTGPTNKHLSTDSDWAVGGWTFERFVAVQMAIWAAEDERRAAYLQAVLARSGIGTKDTEGASCSPSDVSVDCLIGEYLLPASYNVQWGINQCSFWLTRIFEKAMDVYRRKNNTVTCSSVLVTGPDEVWAEGDVWAIASSYLVGTLAATIGTPGSIAQTIFDMTKAWALAAFGSPNWIADANFVDYTYTGGSTTTYNGKSAYTRTIKANAESGPAYPYIDSYAKTNIYWTCPVGYAASYQGGAVVCTKSTLTQTETMNAFNHGKTKQTLLIDQPYCELVGWSYTAADNSSQFVAKPSDTCAPPSPTNPTPPAPQLLGGNAKPLVASDGPNAGQVCSNPFPTITIPDYSPDPIVWPDQTVEVPGTTFLMQDGSIGPIYPDFCGAFVYDLALKKWGKMKVTYRQLLDYRPINASQDGIINDIDVEVKAGILTSDGQIFLFDETPIDSYIKYGKIGYYRLGMTSLEEIKVHFTKECTGSIQTETSLDGESPEGSLSTDTAYADTRQVLVTGNVSGRWHNILISGHYDIKHLEYRGFVSGRR